MIPNNALPQLAGKRAAARAALWWEQLWPAIWPAIGVAMAYIVVALLDLPAWLPPWPRLALPCLVLLGLLAVLVIGLRHVVPPTADAVDRRLERASGLRHRPLSALQDRPAGSSAEAAAVWHVHQSRLMTQVRRLRVGTPRPGLAKRDQAALRGLAVVAVAAAFVVAGREAPARLLAAIYPGLPAGAAAPGTVVQAWITPPSYTGLPPMFLHGQALGAAVPEGAHVTVSVTGGNISPSVRLDADEAPAKALDAASWQADLDIGKAPNGPVHLDVRRGAAPLAGWTLRIIPDQPPAVAFTDPPGAATSSGRPAAQVRMAWHAEDDYGVAGVQAEIRLRDRPAAAPIILSVPLGTSTKAAHGTIVRDLTAHPWAGLPTVVRMVAKDAIGQTGMSEPAPLDLPERRFTNLAARAVIEIRKQLSRAPDNRDAAKQALDALADRPALYDDNAGILLNLRAIASLLVHGVEDNTVDEAQARMWELALALEEGTSDRTAKALEQARQAMRDAMDAAKQDPANKEAQAQLEKRMQELREAIQKHIDALTEQARRENTELPFDPSQPQMNARDLDRMAQQMEQAAREGRMEDAQQQMADLEKLLEQLQNARPEHGEQREQRNAQRRQQGRQQTDAIQDMVRREGSLLDRSRSRADDPAQSRPQSAPQPQAGQPPPPDQRANDQRANDQRAQRAMRRALGELMQRFGDLTGQVPAPLGEADTAMRDAAEATAQGQDGAAGAAQQKAIEALQKGGREMGQQMARQFGRGQQPGEGEGQEGQDGADGEPGQQGSDGNGYGDRDDNSNAPGGPGEQRTPGRRRAARHDPLGRTLPSDTGHGDSGDAVDSGEVRVPDQMEQARTRALQEELRRRGADRSRPQGELDYIDRLLKDY